ncbi:membrane dipeptidase [Novosphingobium profundi]|uniref:dipeptidase n=1 Tax=Novosphingobium profundi TaxID=1774954 RepID=UPI001BDAC3D1|nr:dipeptidase [Novosphingobium profundi]MBT0670904.1 membrane dipeptidase [Novosphingobium profundi]
MSRRPWFALSVAVLACCPALAQAAPSPEQVAAAALAKAPVWDGHNDVPEQLRERRQDILAGFDFADTLNTADAANGKDAMQTDLARLRKGKVGAQFWSVFVPATLSEQQAVQATIEQIDVMKRIIAGHPDQMMYATSSADVEAARKAGKIASLLGMEGGHSIGSSLAVLRQMYALGARYMTLTHFKANGWADSATDAPVHDGMTEFGKDVVREMQRLGMLVDLSHVSARTMADALDVARAPVIFSHSGAMAVDSHPRNVPDDILDRLKANGGIVMVNFYPAYVSEQVHQWKAARAGEATRLGILHPDAPDKVSAGLAAWENDHAKPVASVSQIADHVDHIVKRIGADHVGLGGDFDGGSVGVAGMPDVSAYPALFTELARRGYSQADLEKISSRNMLRVLKAAEAYAAAHRADPPIESPTTF